MNDSVLDGIQQKLPYQMRHLLNQDHSKIAYELQEVCTKGSNSLPTFNLSNANRSLYRTADQIINN